MLVLFLGFDHGDESHGIESGPKITKEKQIQVFLVLFDNILGKFHQKWW